MTNETPGAPKERVPIDIDALPWYKSPWLWGGVIGIASVTLVRPCTQYIPDPLPVVGSIPEWLAEGAPDNAPVSVLTLWEEDCAPCTTTVSALTEVSRRSSWQEVPYEFRIGVPKGTDVSEIKTLFAYETEWEVFEYERPSDWDQGVLAAHAGSSDEIETKWTNFIHEGWVWIIDREGAIRGPLKAQNEDGKSEVYHRAQRVIRELSEGHDARR